MIDKKLIRMMLLGVFTLLFPFLLLMFFAPIVLFALWIVGIVFFESRQRKDPDLKTAQKFQLYRNFLYFQIITWLFALFIMVPFFILIPPFLLIALGAKKEIRERPRFKMWCKYVAFLIFNLVILFILIAMFPYTGFDAIIIIPFITLMNGASAAIYLMIERKMATRSNKRWLMLVLILVMMVMTAMTSFPQESGYSVFQLIFGG